MEIKNENIYYNTSHKIIDFPIDIKYDTIAIKQECKSIAEIEDMSTSTFESDSKTMSYFNIKSEDNGKFITDACGEADFNMEFVNVDKLHNDEGLPMDIKHDTLAINQDCESMEGIYTARVENQSMAKSNFISRSQENDLRMDKPQNHYICRQSVLSCAEALIAHRYTHTLKTNLSCLICQNTFHLKEQKRIYCTKRKRYKCDICHKRFMHKCKLCVHIIRTHSGEKPYECNICYNLFKACLAKRKRSHSEEKPFECDICHKRFKLNSYRAKHKRIHSGKKPYVCVICHKRFACQSNFLQHKRVHTAKMRYECDICDNRFTHRNNLAQHRRTHTTTKPYEKRFECDICHKRFTLRSSVKRHKRIHSGEKPYECDICHKRFIHKGNLGVHIRILSGEKPYISDNCH